MNIFPLQRRDERFMQHLQRRMRDSIGLLFQTLDRMHAIIQIVETRHQRQEFFATLDAQIGMLNEERKKLFFRGQKLSEQFCSAQAKEIFLHAENLITDISGRITGVIFKLGVLTNKSQTHTADRTITLLADNDLGHPFFRRIRVVHFVTVNK